MNNNYLEGRKELVLRPFQQFRSYRGEIETRKPEEIPFSSQIVQRIFFQFKKYHRHPFTTPHIYIATKPAPLLEI